MKRKWFRRWITREIYPPRPWPRVTIKLASQVDPVPHTFLIMPGQVQRCEVVAIVREISAGNEPVTLVNLPVEISVTLS